MSCSVTWIILTSCFKENFLSSNHNTLFLSVFSIQIHVDRALYGGKMSLPKNKPDLANNHDINSLERRLAPYWNTLEYCRHIGVQKHPKKGDYWVARVRARTKGQYVQWRLAPVDFDNIHGKDYNDAVGLAKEWFATPEIVNTAAEPYPVGGTRNLKYTKDVPGFTVGDAMVDYVEWKRIAAANTTFFSILSLINHHIIPRLGNVLVSDLNARRLTRFMVDILETPPKYGRQTPGPRVNLADLDRDALRKRKKTVNTLLGILRLALQMAWENGEFNEERIWRTIRRLPHKDAPRNLFLSREQCSLLLDRCRSDLQLIVLAALYSGCRITELSELLVSDVEPGIQGIYVSPSKNYRGRYVFLPEEGLSFFRAQCHGKGPNQTVFQMKSGRRWSGNHRHLFKAAVRAACLPERFVFHGLRHTYASQLVQAGTPLAIVARQLGHATTDTVSRTYGHLSCENIETEIERRFSSIGGKGKTSAQPATSLKRKMGNETNNLSDEPSWPLANHSKASGPLVKSLRGR
jgi:integrase